MHDVRSLLQDLALVFCVASVVTIVFQRLRQPVVVGYLLAGLLVGPHVVAVPLFADLGRVELLADLGVILVIFSIGLEFRVSELLRVLPTAGIAGAVQISGMLWLGYLFGQLVGWSGRDSLFLGGMVAVSSTMVVARLIQASADATLKEAIFGLLIVQDLAAIVLVAVFTAVASGADLPPAQLATLIGRLALFLVLAVVVGILVVPRLIREAHHEDRSEVLLVTAVGVCFGLALLAARLGYSVALGAFIAGSIIAESGRRRQVQYLVEPTRDLFAAVFFVSIGMLVDPAALVANAGVIAGVCALVVLGHAVLTSVGTFLSGRSIGVSIRTALTLGQIGEFAFIIVGLGVRSGAIPRHMMAIAVGVAVVTTFTTPLSIRLSRTLAVFVEHRLPRPLKTFATLYGAWLESLQSLSPGGHGRGLRRYVLLMARELVIIAGVVIAAALFRVPLAAALARGTGLSEGVAVGIVVAIAAAVMLPFVIGLARTAHRVGVKLSTRALPSPDRGVDLADAPRRALAVALQLVIAFIAMVPLVALTQPFLPDFLGAAVLVVVLGGLGVSFWKSAANLDGHVRAGAELVAHVLGRQRRADVKSSMAGKGAPGDLLPGLGAMVPVVIPPGSRADGKSLAELDLRAVTGATVLAIRHARGDGVAVPAGDEGIAAGDTLVLTGSKVCIDRAVELLTMTSAESGG